MADTVSTKVLANTKYQYIVNLYGLSDGTGESNVVKVDKSSLLNLNNEEPDELYLDRAEWSIGGHAKVTLNWDRRGSEVQTITVDATGGTYTITWNGQTTGNIAFDATAATVQAALEALSNISAGDVTVTGGPGDSGGTTPYTLTWLSSLGNVAAPTTDPALLTGGGGTAAVATTRAGTDTLETMLYMAGVGGRDFNAVPLVEAASGGGLRGTSADNSSGDVLLTSSATANGFYDVTLWFRKSGS